MSPILIFALVSLSTFVAYKTIPDNFSFQNYFFNTDSNETEITDDIMYENNGSNSVCTEYLISSQFKIKPAECVRLEHRRFKNIYAKIVVRMESDEKHNSSLRIEKYMIRLVFFVFSVTIILPLFISSITLPLKVYNGLLEIASVFTST
ncbi:uncharacterized protein LOC109861265 [Pseudomyrmex gracilis]|uniref:uncharacterized protein LOC109861265 n=1 Tax=Pseudomyrmex gracilis TaxID=219809 RepID=UPI000994F5F3|nr:uncharacterized protein LOC109861265 [Pseudomyrmex gracilis]